jgi:hypothetical protein
LFVTYNFNEALVLGDMIGTLSTKFGIRKECVNVLRPSDHPDGPSKNGSAIAESGELYIDDETGEDSNIGITKIFH